MKPDVAKKEDFYSGEVAHVIQENCTLCGKCQEICRFGAIKFEKDQYIVDKLSCEGCGYCARICPTKTIINERPKVGEWYISNVRTGSQMVHARLNIGADNSGKLVAKVKNEARNLAESVNKNLILIDGSPGIGCPVVSSLSGASFVVLVTEPSISGLHDLKRVYQLVKTFNIKAGCIINKADINTQKSIEIKSFLKENNIQLITELPYTEEFTKAMTSGKTIVEIEDKELSELMLKAWNSILSLTS
jgi:MinD superfamily P-loop ATPase